MRDGFHELGRIVFQDTFNAHSIQSGNVVVIVNDNRTAAAELRVLRARHIEPERNVEIGVATRGYGESGTLPDVAAAVDISSTSGVELVTFNASGAWYWLVNSVFSIC